MTDRGVRLDQLGAWLLKGNADAVNLLERFERNPQVDTAGAFSAATELG